MLRVNRDIVADKLNSSHSLELEDKSKEILELRKHVEKMNEFIRAVTQKLEMMKGDNENLLMENRHYGKHIAALKNELQEAWTQRCEIEDQLLDIRKQNAVLNLHRNQLEQTNKRISALVSEGTPSVVSWLKIHETVENIVEEVIALKTSFSDLSPVNTKLDVTKTKSELRLLTESLHLQLDNKTKMCNELLMQKLTLERELQHLEERLRQNEAKILNQKGRFESELRNRDLSLKKWQLELRGKQVSTAQSLSNLFSFLSGLL